MFDLLTQIMNLIFTIISVGMLASISVALFTFGAVLVTGLYCGYSAVKQSLFRFNDLRRAIWSSAEVPILSSVEREALDDLQGMPYFEGTEYKIEICGMKRTVFVPKEHAIRDHLQVLFAYGRSGQIYIRPLRT